MKFIPVAQPTFTRSEERNILNCVKSTWISSTGKYIEIFEKSFADYLKVPYAISVSNGTSALHLSLIALGVGPGDEVILPVLTFVSCANVIRYVGAIPVFVDIDPITWNIDPKKIEAKITKKTKVIMPVHLYGYPAEMDNIMFIAKKYHLYVVEDAAEAHGARYKNKFVGTIGDLGCFSFFGNKIITTGEGGMIVTNKKSLRDKIIILKNHGMSSKRKYFHPFMGFNYRMTNLQAAIGVAQLKKINKFLEKRSQIETYYRTSLKNIIGINFQPVKKEIKHVCWLFSFVLNKKIGKTRNSLILYLKKYGIDSRPFFYPLNVFPMYQSKEKYHIATEISHSGINLPTSINLTYEKIFYISKIIKKFSRN